MRSNNRSIKVIHYKKEEDSSEYVSELVKRALSLGNAANILLVPHTTDVTMVADQDINYRINRADDRGKPLQYITFLLRDTQ